MVSWGQQLRTLRKAQKWSQGDLGERLNPQVTKAYISSIESGKQPPSPRVAKQLESIFNGELSASQGVFESREVPPLAQAV